MFDSSHRFSAFALGFALSQALVFPFDIALAKSVAGFPVSADETYVALAVLSGHWSTVWGPAFSPDGSRIATASADGTARVWDSVSGSLIQVVSGNSAEGISRVDFSNDNGRILTSGFGGVARVWSVDSGGLLFELGNDYMYSAAARISRADWLIATGGLETLQLWGADGEAVSAPEGLESWVEPLSFSPEGQSLLVRSGDNILEVYDASSGALIRTLGNGVQRTFGASYSPDGTRIISAGLERDGLAGIARVWDALTGTELFTLTGNEDWVTEARFSEDSRKILTVTLHHSARLWDADDGQLLYSFGGPEEPVCSADLSPDGSRLVTVDCLGPLVSVWDAESGQRISVLLGHEKAVNAAVFSPDGQKILTTSEDKTAILWGMSK